MIFSNLKVSKEEIKGEKKRDNGDKRETDRYNPLLLCMEVAGFDIGVVNTKAFGIHSDKRPDTLTHIHAHTQRKS